MRLSLRWKTTAALVAFGLIPAVIVAAFAYRSTEDFISKQNTLIRMAASAISDRVKDVMVRNAEFAQKVEKSSRDAPATLNWDPEPGERTAIHTQVSQVLQHFNLPAATVYL